MSQTEEAARTESRGDHEPANDQKKVKNRRPASKRTIFWDLCLPFLWLLIPFNNLCVVIRHRFSAAAIESMAVSDSQRPSIVLCLVPETDLHLQDLS